MNMFRRDKGGKTESSPMPPPRPSKEELDNPIPYSQSTSSQRTGVLGVMQKVNPFKSTSQVSSTVNKTSSLDSSERENDQDSVQKPGVWKEVVQKVNPFKSTSQTPSTVSKAPSSESLEQRNSSGSTQNPSMLKGVMQKMNPFKSTSQGFSTVTKAASSESLDPVNSADSVQENSDTDSQGSEKQPGRKQNAGVFKGIAQKVNPFKSSAQTRDTLSPHSDQSSSTGSLADNNNTEIQNPGVFKGMLQKVNPFKSSAQTQDTQSLHSDVSSSSDSLNDSTIERHSIWYTDVHAGAEVKSQPIEVQKRRTKTFRIRKILPGALFGSGAKDSADRTPETQPLAQEEAVEVQTLEMADVPVPSEGTSIDPLDDEDGLLDWWRTVEGWNEWNESTQDQDTEEVVEGAADRVFMAARLFVRLFNKRGASLQQRILELLSVADAADSFHKKTVTASIGGGVASVAGSVTTITGLILAPFTMGTSLIVTAVGIGVATAGGVASASANITDTVHSKTDRKKVEKMIQGYQEEIQDIKECLDFVQEGMETLEQWDFEAYADSISKKHLNQNVKHVMKEGGRAGKALLINTESLISTVQVLNVAGGAAKAAQVMSVTTGVMSGLFLALDVFFLAKDSVELKKGAKTEFAAKIREVCQGLQDGLLELNRIKEELQRTMDGIEVEEEDEEVDGDVLKSDLKKLAQLEE